MTQHIIVNSGIGNNNYDFYYKVDDQTTLSRNQALLWAGGKLDRIEYYFMDDVWDKIDWSQCPAESFEDMCDRRCRELRAKYDWLCLWLSGGYDSQTVLASFIRAGVRIDEIAYMDRTYFTDPEIPSIIESSKNYQKYHNHKLKITATTIDYNYTFDFYRTLGEDWIFQPGASPRFTKSVGTMIQRFNDQVVRNRLSTSGLRADIYGKEKPWVTLYEGQWYMQAYDRMIEDNIGGVSVNFYLCADMPEFYVKQCHMAIDWMETIPGINQDIVTAIQFNAEEWYMAWNLACGRVPIANFDCANGITKRYFNRSDTSPDGNKLLNHAQNDLADVYHIWQGAKSNLLSSTGLDNLMNIGIFSNSWLIRPFVAKNQQLEL
jgi:hypothetical protein